MQESLSSPSHFDLFLFSSKRAKRKSKMSIPISFLFFTSISSWYIKLSDCSHNFFKDIMTKNKQTPNHNSPNVLMTLSSAICVLISIAYSCYSLCQSLKRRNIVFHIFQRQLKYFNYKLFSTRLSFLWLIIIAKLTFFKVSQNLTSCGWNRNKNTF